MVDQQAQIAVRKNAVAVEYVIRLNRPAGFLEVVKMDTDRDGDLSKEEQARFFAELEKRLVSGLELRLNGRQTPLKPIGEVELSMTPRGWFQKRYCFEVPHPADWKTGVVVEFHNDNYLDFRGRITIQLDPGSEADIVYDSLFGQRGDNVEDAAAAPASAEPRRRDVVFCYRAGSGRYDPAGDSQAASAILARADQAGNSTPAETWWSRSTTPAAWLAAALLGAAAVVTLGGASFHRRRPVVLSVALIALSVCPLALLYGDLPGRWVHTAGVPSDVEAGQIFQQLHRGIYRAFDAKTEDQIYDVLARSLEGDVLDEVYNEVYEALMMRNDGATRFSVRRIKPISTKVLPAESSFARAFRVRYRWRVYGTVTHFGHTPARVNEYEAVYVVRYNGRSWRIADAQVRQHKRLSAGRSSYNGV